MGELKNMKDSMGLTLDVSEEELKALGEESRGEERGAVSSLRDGIALYRDGKYEEAKNFFLSASSDDGVDKNERFYFLGLCFARLNEPEQALLYLEQVVTSSKNRDRMLQCRFLLALVYTTTGRRKLAHFELAKLLDTGYRKSSVYAVLAYIALESGDTERGMNYYRKSLDNEPENITSLNGLGYMLAMEDGDMNEALEYCKKAVEKAPKSSACLDSLGFVFLKLGKLEEAKEYLEKAHEIDSENDTIKEHIKALERQKEGESDEE